MRTIRYRYRDPLDTVWLTAAGRVGLRIERSEGVYASYDGRGTLTLAQSDSFDADDSLAQMIFHELCHALVAGKRGASQVDWGLENIDDRDVIQEHACHRLQAALAAPYGLRAFFAVTTDHRAYWDALPADPLAVDGHVAITGTTASDEVQAIALAREAHERACHGPWSEPLARALEATALLAEVLRGHVDTDDLWSVALPRHVTGFLVNSDSRQTCGSCAWYLPRVPGRSAGCRRAQAHVGRSPRLLPTVPACEHWEPVLSEADCGACGACCREGFHLVTVGARDVVRKRHPELVQHDAHGHHIPRPDGRCLALAGDGQPAAPYRCRIYAERPRACRQFDVGGAACLEARTRAGVRRSCL